MQPAGARISREDDQQTTRPARGLSLVEPEDREAVLQHWERKIEQEERRGNPSERDEPPAEPAAVEPRAARFERAAVAAAVPAPAAAVPVAERRTITITGQPTPPRRRGTLAARHPAASLAAQPDRIALWAFLLGLFLVAVAAGTAHA